LANQEYYWATNQAEYATDVMFQIQNRGVLHGLYTRLLYHASLSFRAEDILTFLGRRLNGHFGGEVLTEYKARAPGARVKHWMKENWIKMYDKHGTVLRVETVINNPYEFKVRREGKRRGAWVLDWFPMAKGVGHLPRYLEVSRAANRRYLDALAIVDSPSRRSSGTATPASSRPRRPASSPSGSGMTTSASPPRPTRSAIAFSTTPTGSC